MEFHAFSFFISLINFMAMFFLFYHVVIVPMEGAVALRAKRVQSRLDEIRQTLSEAQRLEAEVKEQFARLEGEKQEMREATEREIVRVKEHHLAQAERDAKHLVEKTQRELERNRQEVLAALNRQLTDRAMEKVEGLLSKAFDAQAQEASAEAVLGKVASHAA